MIENIVSINPHGRVMDEFRKKVFVPFPAFRVLAFIQQNEQKI